MKDAWACFLTVAAVSLLYVHALGGVGALSIDFQADDTYFDDGNCTVCPPASFANKNGSSNCTKLDKEQLCVSVNGSCIPTPPNYQGQGYRPPGGNQTLCEICPANMFQDEPGQDSCKFCPGGSQPRPSRIECVACNDGEISNVQQTNGLCTSCYQVHYGYKANAAKTACEACVPGTMSRNGISCDLCDPGYYWDPMRGNCANVCTRGHFCVSAIVPESTNLTYCSQCLQCEAGKAQSEDGQYVCEECAPGSYQDSLGAALCKDCQAGKYQLADGMTYCSTCPEGFFCPNTTSKEVCPHDRYCPEGSTQPLQCNSLYIAEPSGCKPTPELMGIVAGSVVGGSVFIALFIYRRYKQYSRARQEETAALLRKEENKHPVYSGL